MRRFDREWQMLESSRSWFREHGYRLIDSRGPEGMDQGYDVHAGDLLGMRIIADRSQWFVELRPGPDAPDANGWEGWFSLEAWSSCLGSPMLFHDTRPAITDEDRVEVLANSWWIEPQFAYLREHLSDIERACSPDRIDTTRGCLNSQRGSV